MIDEDRSCADIIMQVTAARAALAKAARLLLQDHFHTSLTQLAASDVRERRQSVDGLMRLLECCDL
jgi:DNA-binding FrmR family transcriptional regulator